MLTCLMVLFGAQHFDNLAAVEAVPQAIAGHDKASPLLRNLYLHDVRMRNDVLPNIYITNSPACHSCSLGHFVSLFGC